MLTSEPAPDPPDRDVALTFRQPLSCWNRTKVSKRIQEGCKKEKIVWLVLYCRSFWLQLTYLRFSFTKWPQLKIAILHQWEISEHAVLGRPSNGNGFAKNFKGSWSSSNVTRRLWRSKYSEGVLRSYAIYLGVPVYLLWEKEAWCSHKPWGCAFDVKNIDIPKEKNPSGVIKDH